jgi:N-acetylmuramoyl-L-alanine amidase
MRPLRKIILHASGSTDDTRRSLDRRHRARGLRRIAFHYVICTDGKLERGRPLAECGAHCLGFNADSIGICLCGTGSLTPPQQDKLKRLLRRLLQRYPRLALHRVGELDPWIDDPLQLDLNTLRDELAPHYTYECAVRDWLNYIL